MSLMARKRKFPRNPWERSQNAPLIYDMTNKEFVKEVQRCCSSERDQVYLDVLRGCIIPRLESLSPMDRFLVSDAIGRAELRARERKQT